MPKSNGTTTGWDGPDELAFNGFSLAMGISDYLVSINQPITPQNMYNILASIGNGALTLCDPECDPLCEEFAPLCDPETVQKARNAARKGTMNTITAIRETAEQILRAYGGIANEGRAKPL